MEHLTLVDTLDLHSRATPDKDAVVMINSLTDDTANHRLTYSVLRHSALTLATQLRDNYPSGSRILLPTVVSEYFVVAFLACGYAKMIAVPTPLPSQYDHQRQRLSNIVKDAEVAAVCHAPADAGVLQQWIMSEGHSLPLIEVSINVERQNVVANTTNVSPEDIALLQYTSGSTGNPKGVVLTHANLRHNANSFQRTLGYAHHTRFGGWIPQYHDMGLMAQVLPPLFLGSTCYMMTPNQFLRRPLFWLKMISQFGINHSCAPNFAFDLCRKRVPEAELEKLDLSCLHYLINGSEPIQADTIRAFSDYFSSAGFSGTAMQPCYGMAECTVFISGSEPRTPALFNTNREALQAHRIQPETDSSLSQTLVSCGFARDFDVRIADPVDLHPLAEGEIGEIWLQGGSVAQGYWHNSKATKETFHAYLSNGDGPFLRTGDLGFLWQGELFITGRRKEVIIVNGKNLYPQDIEHSLRRQFPELGGKFGAAFGLPQADSQESIGICHELQGTYEPEALQSLSENIRLWVNREWGAPVSSVALLYPGDINRTTSGKIQRTKIKERFLQQTLKARHQWVCDRFAPQLSDKGEVNADA